MDLEGECAIRDAQDNCIVFTSPGIAAREGRLAGLGDGWSVLKVPAPEE